MEGFARHSRASRNRRVLLGGALWVLLLPLTVPSLAAQYNAVPPPAAYALEDVTLVRGSGETARGVTLVIRDHLVVAADTGAAVPADARILEGEGLWIYPGLVDAWGAAEAEVPPPPEASEVTQWDPSRPAQGFTPHRRIVDHLVADGASLADRRRHGVVASGVFPAQGFIGGLGATLLHRPDARVSRELVAVPEVGLHMSFAPSSTSYPATLFGVVARFRQAFSDAQHLARLETEFRQNPNGFTLPEWDPDAEVLRRTAGAGLPAFFQADDVESIRRVIGLAYELGFSPVIVGGGEAWRLAEELAELDVPVLVSVDFPEPQIWDPETDDDSATPGPDRAIDAAAARERERLVDLYSNPARLEEAGARFALTSGGGEADLRSGARRALEHGLDATAALRALTVTPAEILGIPSVTRIVPGYAANLVVTDGPLFEEDTHILYTFVEGVLEEAERGTSEDAEDVEDGGDGGQRVEEDRR